MKLLTRVKKFLNAIYPIILVLTALSIILVCIASIVVLTKFTTFEHAWMYYVAAACIYITTIWWCIYFIYKGLELSKQPKNKRNPKARR